MSNLNELSKLNLKPNDVNVDVPEKHQHHLKQSILTNNTQHSENRHFFQIPNLTNMTVIGSVVAVIVLGIFLYSNQNVTSNVPQAKAQQVVEQAITIVSKLTQTERNALESQFPTDLVAALEEAYEAPDLRYLTREEHVAELYPNGQPSTMTLKMEPNSEEKPLPQEAPSTTSKSTATATSVASTLGEIHYLKYTNNQGKPATIILDGQMKPITMLVTDSSGNQHMVNPSGDIFKFQQ